MTSERQLNMSIKFYTSPKIIYLPKQISGYAPGRNRVNFRFLQYNYTLLLLLLLLLLL